MKCTSALKLAYNTCVTQDLVAGHIERAYVRLQVIPSMPGMSVKRLAQAPVSMLLVEYCH